MPTELGAGFRGPDGRVGFLLRQAHQAFRAAATEALAPLGITGPQYSLLGVAAREPGLSGAELARDSMLTAQSAGEIVTYLERAGWVERRPDGTDRRVRRIHVTADGRRLLDDAAARIHRIEDRMVAHLTGEQIATFRRWLVEIARTVSSDPE